MICIFTSLLPSSLRSIGGSIPIVFSYYSEFLAQEKRGEHLSWLCMFWMLGGIYAAAMAWAIIPHYGESNKSEHSRCVVKAFMSSWNGLISHFYSARWIMLKHFVQLINILKVRRYCVGINKTFFCTCQRFAPNYPLITRKSVL